MRAQGYDYDTQDPTFLADLRESRKAVELVARWLSGRGYPVVVRPTFERPDPSRAAEFSDDGDIEIMQRVEVKQRKTLTFTSKADFPYPSVIVDACHCYDQARPKPYAYVIVNREFSAAFVVKCSTRQQWARVKKLDRQKQREREFYECPMALVDCVTFGEAA